MNRDTSSASCGRAQLPTCTYAKGPQPSGSAAWVGIFDRAAVMFWVVLALIIAVAPITPGVAKLRDWI